MAPHTNAPPLLESKKAAPMRTARFSKTPGHKLNIYTQADREKPAPNSRENPRSASPASVPTSVLTMKPPTDVVRSAASKAPNAQAKTKSTIPFLFLFLILRGLFALAEQFQRLRKDLQQRDSRHLSEEPPWCNCVQTPIRSRAPASRSPGASCSDALLPF